MSGLEYIAAITGTIFVAHYFGTKDLANKKVQSEMNKSTIAGNTLRDRGLATFNHTDYLWKHDTGYQSRFDDWGYVRDDLSHLTTIFNEMNPNELQAKLNWDLLDIKPRAEDMWQGTGVEMLDPLFGYTNQHLPVVAIVQPPYFQLGTARYVEPSWSSFQPVSH